MTYQTGDHVVHPSYGLGSIVRREERRLDGDQRPYYVLETGASTVWVPIRPDGSAALRAVTSSRDLARYRAILSGPPAPLDRDHNKRRLELKERLAPGSFLVLCEVVRDLSALGWQRPLRDADAAVLSKVRDNLLREWAAASGQTAAAAEEEVNRLLQAGRDAYAA
jgi:CarD family transcriptional regulator